MMAGQLNHLIKVDHITSSCDTITGSERVKHDLMTTRADVRWGSGSRVNNGDEIVYRYDVTFMVWLYLRNYINQYDLIHFEGRKFVIQSMEPDPDKRILYLRCLAE